MRSSTSRGSYVLASSLLMPAGLADYSGKPFPLSIKINDDVQHVRSSTVIKNKKRPKAQNALGRNKPRYHLNSGKFPHSGNRTKPGRNPLTRGIRRILLPQWRGLLSAAQGRPSTESQREPFTGRSLSDAVQLRTLPVYA